MKIRLTTFNCENLFGRYRFLDKASPVDSAARLNENYTNTIQIYEVVALEGRSNRVKPQAIAKTQRINTAGAILGAAPDILCVNEVENLPTLRIFNAIYLKNYFDRIVLIEGNDNRGIDVGVLIRRDLNVDSENVRTHADEAYPTGWLPGSNRLNTKILGAATFSRDCLEVDLKIGSSSITLLVNHLKAQSIDFTTKKDTSTQRRLDQAKRVAAIAAEVKNRGRQPIILGDMNKDSREAGYDGSLDPLVKNDALYDPFPGFQPDAEIWSHYYSGDRKVSRLDYILLDASLKSSAKGAEYFRQGLTPKCKQYAGPRLKTLKEDGQEASDHCPTTVVLDL